jgi:hypothetical protein
MYVASKHKIGEAKEERWAIMVYVLFSRSDQKEGRAGNIDLYQCAEVHIWFGRHGVRLFLKKSKKTNLSILREVFS